MRVIAATNRDLEQRVEAGKFREDLYYRLSVFPVQVPPLRRRRDDVVQLALHFLEQACRDFGRGCPKLTRSQVDILRRYDWPGNIRELKNVIERAVILSQGETLRLDLSLPEATVEPSDESEPTLATQSDRVFVTDAEVRKQQRDNMLAALEHADWRISGRGGAAELLGLKPSTLTDRLRAFGIERHRDAGNAATQP